jgi:hypothetical protein
MKKSMKSSKLPTMGLGMPRDTTYKKMRAFGKQLKQGSKKMRGNGGGY